MVAAVLLFPGCASRGGTTTGDANYPMLTRIDVTHLLSPPPAAGDAFARDLEQVRAAQRARSPEQSAVAEASTAVDLFQFASVLGSGFTAGHLPVTTAFFARSYRSVLPFLQVTKDCWSRPRPFQVDPSLDPLPRSFASTKLRSAPAPVTARVPMAPPANSPCTAPATESAFSPSYPSGHAMVGAMYAILLSEMVPEHRSGLFERGWEYGEARILSGVHFPADVEAGRILATVVVGLLEQDARFRADHAEAGRELRAVLGYPP